MVDLSKAEEKVCPFCAETIKAAAIRCRFCQSDLSGTTAAPPAPAAEPPASERPASERSASPAPQPDEQLREAPPRAEAEDSDDVESTPASTWSGPAQPANVPWLAGKRLFGVLVTLCLLLTCLAGYAWYRAENPDKGTAPDGAITSSQARDAGMGAATQLTEKVLTYDWKTLDADMKAAEEVLAPTFRAEYTKAMTGVKAQTVKNQVKLTAKAVATSIISASKTKVEALVFVNQVTTAKGSANQRLDQNRVRVTLTRDGGDWRVSKMDAF